MATGALPFDGASMPELLGVMLRGSPPDPRRAAADAAGSRSPRALLRALAPSPDADSPIGGAFGEALSCAS